MSKVVRAKKNVRHTPLAVQLEQDKVNKRRVRTGKLAEKDKDDITEEEYVSNKLSKKIITKAREQVEEENQDEIEEEEVKGNGKPARKSDTQIFEEFMANDDESSTAFSEISETESMYQDEMTVNEEDERALAMFMNPAAAPKRLLSDIIMDRIRQFENNEKRKAEGGNEHSKRGPDIKPEIMHIYTKVGEVLRHFTSGKLPKAFKVLPSLRNWEQLMYLTRPDTWTAVATRMATFLFSRGMTDKLVQRFYFIILLPKIREEIQATRKLNFHCYLALKKSLYRPAAFFRGILLPICEAGDCTLREASIIGSVMRRVSIPAIHASVAIYKLCQMEYFGATQYFMLVLLNKKFSLPYKVIDAVAEYFMNFLTDLRKLPLLWHNTLLIFAQRYKGDLTAEQKQGLQQLTTVHKHTLITPEVNRELFSVQSRGEASEVNAAGAEMEV